MAKKENEQSPEPTVTPASGDEMPSNAAEDVETAADDSAGPLSFPIVGVGASAGGLEAFKRLLGALPTDTGMAFVLVQHLAASHPSALAEILSRTTTMPVTEVQDEPRIEPNTIYVIPPDREMIISKGELQLFPREAGLLHRPVDRFLRSLAEAQAHQSIGVILSGTNTDGTLGLEAIKAEGGITFAQDDTAQQDVMPHSAIASGCVDFVLPPERIAQEIARIARIPRAPTISGKVDGDDRSNLKEIINTLHESTGVDFNGYKTNTLLRRVTRRMILSKSDGLPSYLDLLQKSPEEIEALFQDVLISVTSFFRDPESFEALKTMAFPELVKQRSGNDPLRIWTLGCSTGEEVYSLAIAYAEFAEAAGCRVPLQSFATDLNTKGIDHARAGVYHKGIVEDVSPERLARFFVETDDGYRIIKPIRDDCVFSKHNVLADPPFSRIDLISCRNLLIYMEPVLQQRIVPLLHYALKPKGVLWLGRSESIASHRDLFEVRDPKHKIFVKKAGSSATRGLFLHHLGPSDRSRLGLPSVRTRGEGDDLDREANRFLMAKYVPPSVLVSADYEILRYRGDTSPYLAPAPGKASLNLLRMLRGGLLVGVRSALIRAEKEGVPVREDCVRVSSDGGDRAVVVEVVPLKGNSGGLRENGFLILFEEADASDQTRPGPGGRSGTVGPKSAAQDAEKDAADAAEQEISRLTQELVATREYLQAVIEQQESINEELQSANEEVQSSNEELQSTNEELETSKEEIQSSLEELAIVNDELSNRNVELLRLSDDLINLTNSIEMPIVILDLDFRIRRFTPSAADLFHLAPSDTGRLFRAVEPGFDLPDLEPLLIEARDSDAMRQREVRNDRGHWYLLRARPYKTRDGQTEGMVVMLIDVNDLKNAQKFADSIVSTVRESLLVLDSKLCVQFANDSFYETFDLKPEAVEGAAFFDLFNGRWEGPELRGLLERIVALDGTLDDFEVRQELEPGREKTLLLNARRLVQEGRQDPSILLAIQDVTELKRVEQALRDADRRKNEFLAMLAHELRNPLAAISYAEQAIRVPSGDDEQGRSKEIIGRQVAHLSRLIDDLLDVSRITRGKIKLKPEPVSLSAIIDNAVETSRSLIDEKRHQLTVSIEPATMTLQADPMRLGQIISNLITNAAKYTEDGGRISLDARAEGDQCVVVVKDNGQGIEAEMLSEVFDLFTQAETSVHRSQGGLGIGLTLVKTLAELHGGSVEARSQGAGLGSEFTLRLPLLSQSGLDLLTTLEGPVPSSFETARVLIVDDNVDSARGLMKLLERRGHDVRVIHDGPSALEEARAQAFDVILLDIGLPGLSGYEVAAQLRENGSSRESVIIAVSGYGQDEDHRRSRDAGINHHLVKPIDPNALLALMSKSR